MSEKEADTPMTDAETIAELRMKIAKLTNTVSEMEKSLIQYMGKFNSVTEAYYIFRQSILRTVQVAHAACTKE